MTMTKGKFNHTLVIRLDHFKPGLDFDLFTVQNSPLQSDGTTDSTFTNFGLAWYQSDIKIGPFGYGSVKITLNWQMRSSVSIRRFQMQTIPRRQQLHCRRLMLSTSASGSITQMTRPNALVALRRRRPPSTAPTTRAPT